MSSRGLHQEITSVPYVIASTLALLTSVFPCCASSPSLILHAYKKLDIYQIRTSLELSVSFTRAGKKKREKGSGGGGGKNLGSS